MKLKPKIVKPVKCLRCGHEWYPIVDDPKFCLRCKNPNWKTEKPEPKYMEKNDASEK